MSQKTYRAAAIGHTGAGNYGHGLHVAYKNLENVEFIAVADPDDAGRKKAVEETGAIRDYPDYRDMLAKEELDIVSVCPRWIPEHLEMVPDCLEAGCHIYCEKPMTATLADGDAIVSAAKEKGLKIAIAHQGVYSPVTQALKKALAEGIIGDVQAIYAHGKQDGRGGGEDMITLGTHTFNMMRFLVGDVKWMHAHITINGREITIDDAWEGSEPVGPVAGDCVNSYFAFKSGVSGLYDSRKDQFGRGGMEILGSEGVLLPGGGPNSVTVYPDAGWSPRDESQKRELVQICDPPSVEGDGITSGNQLAIIDLIDAIENDRKPVSSAEDAVAALEMIVGAYESQLSGGRVDFPIENREHPLKRGSLE